MANIALGIATSHGPMLSLPPELWGDYGKADVNNKELVFPPEGYVLTWDEAAVLHSRPELRAELAPEVFARKSKEIQESLDRLADTLRRNPPDVAVLLTDDQDEWFYDSNMPSFSVYWGKSVPLIPRNSKRPGWNAELTRLIDDGYGDVELEVPVAADLGGHVIEYLVDHDFDVSHFTHVTEQYGGTVQRRYTGRSGPVNVTRESPPRRQGLPHGHSFVVKRLFNNAPPPILPVFLNTCYPPNNVRPRRAFDFGRALAAAIESWPCDVSVAVIASGGLSHFVVDEEIDRLLLTALETRDASALCGLPKERFQSGSSESLNWVCLGGAMQKAPLELDFLSYVPVYRTEVGTGGGWGFASWTAAPRDASVTR